MSWYGFTIFLVFELLIILIIINNFHSLTEKNYHGLNAVWRIRDVYPGSRILIFTHPGSRIQKQQRKRGVKKNLMSYLSM